MIISDLNYMEAVEANVEGGRGRGRGGASFSFKKRIDTDVKVRLDVVKDVDTWVILRGNLADAEAYADAYGKDSLAETLTVTKSTNFSSSAYSGSISASN